MSQTISPYDAMMPRAFIGMKADSMEDNVDTFACDALPIPFGVVVGRAAANGLGVEPGTANGVVGIAIHDHVVGTYGGYTQFDAVSVLTRGRAWARVKTGTVGIVDGLPVFYDAATGEVTTGAGVALANAVFRSAPITVPPVGISTVGGGECAVVELHYPFA